MKSRKSHVFTWVTKPMVLCSIKWIVLLSLASSIAYPTMQHYNVYGPEKFALEKPNLVMVGLRVFDLITVAVIALLGGAITTAMVMLANVDRHKSNDSRTEVIHA
jgi:uncharacterized membrane protein YjgN (DUF898 family)